MAAINSVADLSIEGAVALLTINSPPVNALSQPVRDGLKRGVEAAEANGAVKAIIIICDGRTFIAGADISEFGKPPAPPYLPEALDAMENASKPVIAAIHGTALGGGFEVALTAHYRIAVPSAKCGPAGDQELGIIPGGCRRHPAPAPPHRGRESAGRRFCPDVAVWRFRARPRNGGVVDELTPRRESCREFLRFAYAKPASSPKRRR